MVKEAKSLKAKIDEQPTTKWVAVTALITFLGTSGGIKVVDRFFPDTRAELQTINATMAKQSETLALQERNLQGLTRAMWRAGIRATNQVEQVP